MSEPRAVATENQYQLDIAAYPEQMLLRYPFSSPRSDFYPRGDYEDSGGLFQALLRYYLKENRYSDQYLFRHLQLADRTIEENLRFEYLVVTDREERRFNGATLLFHGLNEKSWSKYLPWAQRLCRLTSRPVILFPIAFHMDRAPADWSAPPQDDSGRQGAAEALSRSGELLVRQRRPQSPDTVRPPTVFSPPACTVSPTRSP